MRGDEPRAQERAQRGKDQPLVALLLHIVEEDVAQQVARQRRDAAAAEPCGLARAGQADGQHHVAFGRLRRALGGLGLGEGTEGISGWVSTSRRARAGRLIPLRLGGAIAVCGRLGLSRAAIRPAGISVPRLCRPRCAGRSVRGCATRAESSRIKRHQRSAVDSMGVPDRSCLWILKYLGRVWSVFSCCLQLQQLRTDTGIPYFAERALQIVCTPSHTVPSSGTAYYR